MSESIRAYLYRIAGPLILLLVGLGFISSEDAQLYLNLAAAVLGFGAAGLATVNTSTKGD